MTDNRVTFRLDINGQSRDVETEANATLLDVLRNELGLTGTKYNCEQGECGACTVLVGGEPMTSCIILAATIEGTPVTTVEGLAADDGELDHIQQAFVAYDAAQCGYCTPGMLMAATGILSGSTATSEDIEIGLGGNYCRCTGYLNIVEAIEHVAASACEGGRCDDCGYQDSSGDVLSESLTERVTGRLTYVADTPHSDMLHATFVRLPSPRATITAIETSVAEAVTGVVKVFTGADLERNGSIPRFGPQVADQPILAGAETRYEGEPVAVVVAETERISRAAAALVRVTYEELPPITDRAASLSSPPLHSRSPDGRNAGVDSNVMGEWHFEDGDLTVARAASSVIIEDVYTAPLAHHFAMEVPACIARPEGAGVVVETPVQHPFSLRLVLATMLGLPELSVRVKCTTIGGSFGSKGYPKLEPVAAVLALTLGAPIRIRLTAEEAFLYAQREASDIWMRTGFDNDGLVQFHEVEADFLVGAYTDISPRVVAKAGLHALTPYTARARRVRARGLFTSTPPTTAFRGFGAPHAAFALESQLNAGAAQLGLDPVSLRLRNVLGRGDPVVGDRPADGDWSELLTTTATAFGWSMPKKAGLGRGIALGLKSCVPATKSSARVVLHPDLGVSLQIGTTEMGQGTHDTLRALVADLLGLECEAVAVAAPDTSVVPYDALTASSRSLVHMGNAVERACQDIIRQLADLQPPNLQTTAPTSARDLIGAWHASAGAEIIGEGTFEASANPSHVLGGLTPFYEVVATAVELEVDADTGIVTIHRIVHTTDAGKVLNRKRASGLDEGGVIMGLGLAMSEQLAFGESGLIANGSSLDYRIPTVHDIPRMTSLFIENADGPGPSGSKGLAEGGVLAVAPAIAAAIYDCTGVRLTDLPFTPERITDAMQEVSL